MKCRCAGRLGCRHPDLVATEIERIGPGKFTSFLRERLRLQSHSFTPSEWCQAELAAEHRRHMLLRRETTIRSDVPHRAIGCSKQILGNLKSTLQNEMVQRQSRLSLKTAP